MRPPTRPPAARLRRATIICRCRTSPAQKIAVRKRIDVDGADLTDARAGTNPETGEWVVNFTFNSVGARRFADVSRANVTTGLRSCWTTR